MKFNPIYLLLLIFITACGGGGGGGSSSNSSSDEPGSSTPNLPEITFNSSTDEVFINEDFSITWTSSYANSCVASGDWSELIDISGTSTLSFDTSGQYIFSISCTGSGGTSSKNIYITVIDVITIGNLVFEVNQNSTLESILPVTNNTNDSIEFSLNTDSVNGTTLIFTDGSFSYTPNENYSGTDSFVFNVSIPNKSFLKSYELTINILPNNSPPSLVINDNTGYKYHVSIEPLRIKALVSDPDNTIDSLIFSAVTNNDEELAVSYNSATQMLNIDTGSISMAGEATLNISVSDGDITATDTYEFWNLKEINNDSNIKAYSFIGSVQPSDRLINYVFILDNFPDELSLKLFRDRFINWLEFINDNNLDYFIDKFFNIHLIESQGDQSLGLQTGTTFKEDNNFNEIVANCEPDCDGTTEYEAFFSSFEEEGCDYRDDNIYCFINSTFTNEVSTYINSAGINNIQNISIITGTEGRGVACGGCSIPINIQEFYIGDNYSEDVYVRSLFHTLKHEFGHSFNILGDEYRSDYWEPEDNEFGSINCLPINDYYDDLIQYDVNSDGTIDDDEEIAAERDGLIFDAWCHSVDWSPNTTSEDNPMDLKWLHLVEDLENIPGYHDENNKEGIGMFTGTYFGINHTARPTYDNIMGEDEDYWGWVLNATKGSGSSWDQVGIESFVIQALKYQGLHDFDVNITQSGTNIELGLKLPFERFELNWYVNGQIDPSLKNNLTLNIPSSSGWQTIAYRISEVPNVYNEKKYIFVTDEINVYSDVYQGIFSGYDQVFYCEEPYTEVKGYEDTVCFSTIRVYDSEVDADYPVSYDSLNYNEIRNLWSDQYGDWISHFIEKSGLGGQIGINWNNQN